MIHDGIARCALGAGSRRRDLRSDDPGPAAPGHCGRRLRRAARCALLRLPGSRRSTLADRRRLRGAARDDRTDAGQTDSTAGAGRVSRRVRIGLFLVAAAVFGSLLVWGLLDLPNFGDYQGPYGDLLAQGAVPERHATEVVGATTFDYRGFDTLGEEYILFAAVLGAQVLLRQQRGEQRDEGEELDHPADRQRHDTSDALRLLGLGLVGPLIVLGIYVVVHGHLTPGGGFQGGIIIASAFVLVHAAGRYLILKRVRPMPLVEITEASGAAGFALIG